MKTQPEALRLADALSSDDSSLSCMQAAATELRRLHQSEREGWRHADELEQERQRLKAVNTELLEALKGLLLFPNNPRENHKARAAINKAEAA